MRVTAIRRLAIVIGVMLPIAEAVRRWPLSDDYPPAFLDDFLIGVFLVYGAWRSATDCQGTIILAAAWAFACGLGYASFFSHVRSLAAPDPSGLPHALVAAVIGAGWLVCIVALVATIRSVADST
jgi:hypothetical protein